MINETEGRDNYYSIPEYIYIFFIKRSRRIVICLIICVMPRLATSLRVKWVELFKFLVHLSPSVLDCVTHNKERNTRECRKKSCNDTMLVFLRAIVLYRSQ